jgi:hypothetical protein
MLITSTIDFSVGQLANLTTLSKIGLLFQNAQNQGLHLKPLKYLVAYIFGLYNPNLPLSLFSRKFDRQITQANEREIYQAYTHLSYLSCKGHSIKGLYTP